MSQFDSLQADFRDCLNEHQATPTGIAYVTKGGSSTTLTTATLGNIRKERVEVSNGFEMQTRRTCRISVAEIADPQETASITINSDTWAVVMIKQRSATHTVLELSRDKPAEKFRPGMHGRHSG